MDVFRFPKKVDTPMELHNNIIVRMRDRKINKLNLSLYDDETVKTFLNNNTTVYRINTREGFTIDIEPRVTPSRSHGIPYLIFKGSLTVPESMSELSEYVREMDIDEIPNFGDIINKDDSKIPPFIINKRDTTISWTNLSLSVDPPPIIIEPSQVVEDARNIIILLKDLYSKRRITKMRISGNTVEYEI